MNFLVFMPAQQICRLRCSDDGRSLIFQRSQTRTIEVIHVSVRKEYEINHRQGRPSRGRSDESFEAERERAQTETHSIAEHRISDYR